jgi:hypothetical protein
VTTTVDVVTGAGTGATATGSGELPPPQAAKTRSAMADDAAQVVQRFKRVDDLACQPSEMRGALLKLVS